MPHQRFPKVEILSLEPHHIKFVLSETDTSVANSLRRIMIAEVPTMAIDLVEFEENTTVLNDEYIAHRLGLIPLRFSPDEGIRATDPSDPANGDDGFVSHRECSCYDSCVHCSVEFVINESHAVADDEEAVPKAITSKSLQSKNHLVQPAHFLSDEERDSAADEGICIVKLGPDQKLKMRAIARLGTSKEHAKWCPVAVATYRFWPEIYINDEQMATLTLDQKQEIVDCCPDKILELDELSGMVRAVDNAWDLCTYTEDLKFVQGAMKKRPEDADFVVVKESTDRFVFSVETTGAIDAEEVVMSALRVLRNKLNYLAQELETLSGA